MPQLLGSPLPLVAAPMAGGATTPALARAVADAGGFAFLAGGYQRAEALAVQVEELSAHGAPFGVNLFVPGDDAVDAAALAAYAHELQPEADRFGLRLGGTPVRGDDDHWLDKLALLREHPVPVVSFTFGLPPAAEVAALRAAGSAVLATVTTPDEARVAADTGVDGLVVQGWAAGGHSATFDPARRPREQRTADLVTAVGTAVDLPLVAAGGVDGPVSVAELLAAGAQAVAVGTLLLRTDESGANATHRDALADPRFTETVLTHAFTGRPARALRNAFVDAHDATAPLGYPAVHHLTAELRRAAARAHDPDRLHLWAGTGFRSAATGPAAAVVAGLTRAL